MPRGLKRADQQPIQRERVREREERKKRERERARDARQEQRDRRAAAGKAGATAGKEGPEGAPKRRTKGPVWLLRIGGSTGTRGRAHAYQRKYVMCNRSAEECPYIPLPRRLWASSRSVHHKKLVQPSIAWPSASSCRQLRHHGQLDECTAGRELQCAARRWHKQHTHPHAARA